MPQTSLTVARTFFSASSERVDPTRYKSYVDQQPLNRLIGIDWPGPPDLKEVTANQICLRTVMALLNLRQQLLT